MHVTVQIFFRRMCFEYDWNKTGLFLKYKNGAVLMRTFLYLNTAHSWPTRQKRLQRPPPFTRWHVSKEKITSMSDHVRCHICVNSFFLCPSLLARHAFVFIFPSRPSSVSRRPHRVRLLIVPEEGKGAAVSASLKNTPSGANGRRTKMSERCVGPG